MFRLCSASDSFFSWVCHLILCLSVILKNHLRPTGSHSETRKKVVDIGWPRICCASCLWIPWWSTGWWLQWTSRTLSKKASGSIRGIRSEQFDTKPLIHQWKLIHGSRDIRYTWVCHTVCPMCLGKNGCILQTLGTHPHDPTWSHMSHFTCLHDFRIF